MLFSMAHKLTDNFTLDELTATDTGLDNSVSRSSVAYSRILAMARLLQNVRNIVNFPIYVNSCYRSREVNHAVGGSPRSFHLLGEAADIRIWHLSDSQRTALEGALLSYVPCEFIKYDTFWHVAYDFNRLGTHDGKPTTWEHDYPELREPCVVDGDL